MGKINHIVKGAADQISEVEWDADTTHLDSQGNTAELSRSATLVIAASNASAKSKAGADTTASGANDEVDIQAGITELA